MDRILTISIAAYNVENYIKQAVESCVIEQVIDDIEIIIVDDGATDRTAEIAKQYEKKYPQSIKFVHKVNGGYGTTVNTSVRMASGKYFKLLDGDDWFDRDGLIKLIGVLKNTKSDIVYSRMYNAYPNQKVLVNDSWKNFENKQIKMSELPAGVNAGMWETTIRTSILKEHWIDLPSKTLYTDHIYLMIPLPYVELVEYTDFPVYCYRLGYDEQSVSDASRRKHVEEILQVSRFVTQYFHNNCLKTDNEVYARERARFCHMEAIRALFLLPCNLTTLKKIKEFDRELLHTDRSVYDMCARFGERKSIIFMRKTGYLGFFLVVAKRKNR